MISKHASLQPITHQSKRCLPSPPFVTSTVTEKTSWQDYDSTDGFGMEQVEKIGGDPRKDQHTKSPEVNTSSRRRCMTYSMPIN